MKDEMPKAPRRMPRRWTPWRVAVEGAVCEFHERVADEPGPDPTVQMRVWHGGRACGPFVTAATREHAWSLMAMGLAGAVAATFERLPFEVRDDRDGRPFLPVPEDPSIPGLNDPATL